MYILDDLEGVEISKVLGIITMVYQCSTIQAMYTD